MKTLHKYLLRQVAASLALTLAVFTFVLLIGNVLQQILDLLRASPGLVIEAVGLLIPFVWVFALPMGLLTATLLVFGRFSADQELTAARASGISLLSLITPVLLLSLLCCGFSAWINMDLGPRSRVEYKNLIYRARADIVNMQLPEGRFISDFPGYTFYVEKNDGGKLKNVIAIDTRETNSTTTIRAPRGFVEADKTNKVLTVHLLDARSVTWNGGHAILSSSPEFVADLTPNMTSNQVYSPKISDMTFWQLCDAMADVQKRLGEKMSLPKKPSYDLDSPDQERKAERKQRMQQRAMMRARMDVTEPIRVEMHRQIAFSFACFGFALVGIPLGIRMHRRETNIGVAIALGLTAVYYTFMILGQSLSSHPNWAPHLIFWLPNFIFQAVGAVLLWRANKGV